ncbi:hypothetical protein Efla_000985 [Eimeria flavescens]
MSRLWRQGRRKRRKAAATAAPVPSHQDTSRAPPSPSTACSLLRQQRKPLLLARGQQQQMQQQGGALSTEALRRILSCRAVEPGLQGAFRLENEETQCLAAPASDSPLSGTARLTRACNSSSSASAATVIAASDLAGVSVNPPAAETSAAAAAVAPAALEAPASATRGEAGAEDGPRSCSAVWRLKRSSSCNSSCSSCCSDSISSNISISSSGAAPAEASNFKGRRKLQRNGPSVSPEECVAGGHSSTALVAVGSSGSRKPAGATHPTEGPIGTAVRTSQAQHLEAPQGAAATGSAATTGASAAHAVAAACASQPSSGGSQQLERARAAASSSGRPWVHLPEPLLLQVLGYGGREIGMTCRRFAAIVRRRRRVLRYTGEASSACSADALITAITSSPDLRLLEVTAGGGLSAAQLERLSRARSGALPQRLQVLVMRRCSKITDKGLRTLLLRLRELRCVDLRDSFSLTDEALSMLGLLPHLERVALGLTAGARGCCRLTCRTLKALFTPQQQQQQQQRDAMAPIKFLSLARCSEMKDFSVLSGAAKTLEFLDLRGTAIDDASASVFSLLSNLQVLVLADTAVTTATISAVVDGCPKLQMLDLSCIGPVSRDCLFRLALSLQGISRLKLSHTAAIDDALLAHLLAELPRLRFLDVSHCWRVTSAFCEAPFVVAAGKQLKRLGLYACNVERQKVEAALLASGATNARLFLHNEMALFEMPRVYSTMKDLDI